MGIPLSLYILLFNISVDYKWLAFLESSTNGISYFMGMVYRRNANRCVVRLSIVHRKCQATLAFQLSLDRPIHERFLVSGLSAEV